MILHDSVFSEWEDITWYNWSHQSCHCLKHWYNMIQLLTHIKYLTIMEVWFTQAARLYSSNTGRTTFSQFLSNSRHLCAFWSDWTMQLLPAAETYLNCANWKPLNSLWLPGQGPNERGHPHLSVGNPRKHMQLKPSHQVSTVGLKGKHTHTHWDLHTTDHYSIHCFYNTMFVFLPNIL